MINQFNFQNNLLKLSVQKSPVIIRAILFLLAFISFFFPVLVMIVSIASGNRFHISYLIGIGVFSLLGFYLLRIALWNTYGEEIILFSKNELLYEANYGWFKDAKKSIVLENIEYLILPIGYEEENKSILIIQNDQTKIECAVKMPKEQLEKLISLIRDSN